MHTVHAYTCGAARCPARSRRCPAAAAACRATLTPSQSSSTAAASPMRTGAHCRHLSLSCLSGWHAVTLVCNARLRSCSAVEQPHGVLLPLLLDKVAATLPCSTG